MKALETAEVIASMLKQNTGKHFLDSGMDNGRHWQQNQKRDFSKEAQSTVEFREYDGKPEVNVTHNVYHWLNSKLEFAPKMDAKFKRWANLEGNRDKSNLELMEAFVDRLKEKGQAQEDFGYYGSAPMTVNTYNGEDLLSQVLQYTGFTTEEGEDIILLQIHGGADVRGGYTNPRAFYVSEEAGIFDNARGAVYCENRECEANWTTDDGCHWYPEGACGRGYTQLETYDAVTLEAGQAPELGKVSITEDHEAFCPKCATGKLKASFY